MNPSTNQTFTRRPNPLTTLRRLARPRTEAELCEFCSLPLPPGHRHLLEIATRKLVCACDPCALRFDNVIGRYKLVPRDSRRLTGFHLSDAQWDSFALPIQLAFFFHYTPAGKVVALYPSPAGATESLLPLASWEALVKDNPVLAQMEPDVQALLANRLKGAQEYYLTPIDVCFELVGVIRLHWRGFSGGDKVWQELDDFFSRLNQNAALLDTAPGVRPSSGAAISASQAAPGGANALALSRVAAPGDGRTAGAVSEGDHQNLAPGLETATEVGHA